MMDQRAYYNRRGEIFATTDEADKNACGRDRAIRTNYIKLLGLGNRNILLPGLRLHRGAQGLAKACTKLYVVRRRRYGIQGCSWWQSCGCRAEKYGGKCADSPPLEEINQPGFLPKHVSRTESLSSKLPPLPQSSQFRIRVLIGVGPAATHTVKMPFAAHLI